MNTIQTTALAAAALVLANVGASAADIRFSEPLQTNDGTLRADGVSVSPGIPIEYGIWYVDRVKPAGFETVSFQGGDRLRITIAAADHKASDYNNIQGRIHKAAPGTMAVSASIYLNPEWAELENGFRAGLGTQMDNDSGDWKWGMFSVSNQKGSNTEVGSVAFRVNSSTGWRVFDLADVGTELGEWAQLQVVSNGASTSYYVNGIPLFTDEHAYTVNHFENITLNSFNGGETFSVYWGDISFSAVPEPQYAGILLGVAAALVMVRRRRHRG